MKTQYHSSKLMTDLGRCYNASKAILRADTMILNEIGNPTFDNRVNLHFWDARWEIGEHCPYNLGDNLSELIVEYMLQVGGVDVNTEIKGKKHLYAVGSIIAMGYQNATIWGSGILQPLSTIRRFFNSSFCRTLDIRAVRGPITRDLMLKMGHKCPEVYGDPAILMPSIYKPKKLVQKSKYLLIPHFSKEMEYRGKVGIKSMGSMITKDYASLLDKIANTEKVISGSLHGIILSEAYGIPALFLRDRAAYKDLKYKDYYESTNRNEFKYATTLEEAIDMPPMPLPQNLQQLREGLIKAFPYDLWIDAQNKY